MTDSDENDDLSAEADRRSPAIGAEESDSAFEPPNQTCRHAVSRERAAAPVPNCAAPGPAATWRRVVDQIIYLDIVTRVDRRTAAVLLGCSLVGAIAASGLSTEEFHASTDLYDVASCTLNEKVSCLSVLSSPQAEFFGFPNPLIGLLAFGALAAAAAALLAAPPPLARWFWMGLQVGTTAGVVFVHWLAAQSSVVIGALCPYCMAVWAASITAFVYVTVRNFTIHRLQLQYDLARRRLLHDPSTALLSPVQRHPVMGAGLTGARSLVTSPAVLSTLWVMLLLSAAISAILFLE